MSVPVPVPSKYGQHRGGDGGGGGDGSGGWDDSERFRAGVRAVAATMFIGGERVEGESERERERESERERERGARTLLDSTLANAFYFIFPFCVNHRSTDG